MFNYYFFFDIEKYVLTIYFVLNAFEALYNQATSIIDCNSPIILGTSNIMGLLFYFYNLA